MYWTTSTFPAASVARPIGIPLKPVFAPATTLITFAPASMRSSVVFACPAALAPNSHAPEVLGGGAAGANVAVPLGPPDAVAVMVAGVASVPL